MNQGVMKTEKITTRKEYDKAMSEIDVLLNSTTLLKIQKNNMKWKKQ